MSAIAFPVLVVALLLCVPLAGRMAVRRDRSAKLWMWLAAFLGPFPSRSWRSFRKHGIEDRKAPRLRNFRVNMPLGRDLELDFDVGFLMLGEYSRY